MIKTNITEEKYVSGLIPERELNTNKGDYGKILIISGSIGMTGAGCLAAGACLRTGAGLVYLAVPASLSAIYETVLIEAITIPLEDDGTGYLGRSSIPQILERLSEFDVVVIGPGLSTHKEIFELVEKVIISCDVPLLIDADGLNALSKDISILGRAKCKIVITPHPGEMARLTGMSIKEIQENRISVASEFSYKYGIMTVLKGSKTIIASADGTVYINQTGNPGMATGGTGDVLTGVIASLIGQGLDPFDASVAGAYLHGMAGDNVAAKKGMHGLIAGDLVEELPYTISKLLLSGSK